jgi:hypothetical protein
MTWSTNISIADLPAGKMQDIAFSNGIDDAISLLDGVPGLRLYVPVYGNKKVEFEYVLNNHTGKNSLSILSKLKINFKRLKYLLKQRYKYDKKPFFSNQYIQLVAEKCGDDVATRLIKNFSGEYIYIPINGYKELKKKKILSEFDGKNSSILALRYAVSERWINKIVAERHAKLSVHQGDLFEISA